MPSTPVTADREVPSHPLAGPTATELTAPRTAHAGDLARRITHRRHELGLSTEELARRSGMDAWFLAYFEQSSDTCLSGGSLLRLAVALETTLMALEGGQVDRAPGEGHAGLHPALEELSDDQCRAHLGAGGVGRIVLSTATGPAAYPVNFVFADGLVIFRTSESMAAAASGIVAFEVDHIDEAMSEGWSVLLRGHSRLIEDQEERMALVPLDIEPWAGGPRLNLVEITPFDLTGRVIVQHGSTHNI
jgi:nitroimidazol reductase NimA-like FMN-containing flavoprotein (pyridoxamine 5'-phosphate oxidase superfamily)